MNTLNSPEKKGLLSIILIAILVIVGFMVLRSIKFTPLKAPQVIRSNRPLPALSTVHLTDGGFSPNIVTIKKGTAVIWVNESSSKSASVNSDDYPTNKLYPELNLGKFLKGSTMSHIFDKAGVYTYHNQFAPDQTGQINVE